VPSGVITGKASFRQLTALNVLATTEATADTTSSKGLNLAALDILATLNATTLRTSFACANTLEKPNFSIATTSDRTIYAATDGATDTTTDSVPIIMTFQV
jgi:hypothetical protein